MSELSLREQKLIADIRRSNPQLIGKSDSEVLSILASENTSIILTAEQKVSILQLVELKGNVDEVVISAPKPPEKNLTQGSKIPVEYITQLTEEQAQNYSMDLILNDLEKALKVYNGVDNGIISEGYDKIKEFLDLNLASKNVHEVLDKEALCVHFLQKAQSGKLTKKEYYLENKARLKQMMLNRIKNINPLDYRLNKEMFDKIVESYLTERLDEISSMEEIKDMQHEILTMSEDEEAQFAQKIVSAAITKAQNSREDVDTSFLAKINKESQHPFFTDEPLSFEEVYSLERGVAFSQRAMEKYMQTKGEYDYVNGAYSKVEGLKAIYKEFYKKYQDDTEIIYDESGNIAYEPNEPSSEERKDEFLNYINQYFGPNPDFCVEILKEVSKKQGLIINVIQDEDGKIDIELNPYSDNEKLKNKQLNLLFKGILQAQEKRLNEEILQGKKYEDFVEANLDVYKKAFGEENSEELATAFEQDQVSFVDTATGVITTGGMIALCVGGLLKFYPPTTALGISLMAVGGKVAMAGQITNSGLGLTEAYTRDEVNEEETSRRWKDLALLAGGMAVGGYAGFKGAKYADDILAAGGSKAAAVLSHAGTDFGISLVGDLAMIGLLDYDQDLKTTIKQNGIGLLISTITGNYVGRGIYDYKKLDKQITDLQGKKAELATKTNTNTKIVSFDEILTKFDNPEVSAKLKSLIDKDPDFIESLVYITKSGDLRFDTQEMEMLLKSYEINPEFTKLVIESKKGEYYNFNYNQAIKVLNAKAEHIDLLKEVVSMQKNTGEPRFSGREVELLQDYMQDNFNSVRDLVVTRFNNGSYRIPGAYSICRIIDAMQAEPELVSKLLFERNLDGDFRYNGQNVEDLVQIKRYMPEIYDILVNETDIKDRRILSRGNSGPYDLFSKLKAGYDKDPERVIKLLRAKDESGSYLYDTSILADNLSKIMNLSDELFNKIYANKSLMDMYSTLCVSYDYYFEDKLREGYDKRLIAKLFEDYKDDLNSAKLVHEGYRRIAESVGRDFIKNDSITRTSELEAEYKILNDWLKTAEVPDIIKLLYSKNPMAHIKNNLEVNIMKNIEQTRAMVKNEKVLGIIDNFIARAQEEGITKLQKKACLSQAQKIIDIYNAVRENYTATDKDLQFRELFIYAKKKNPELAEALEKCDDPFAHPEYALLKADFIKEMKYAELIDYCKNASVDNPEIANTLYSELYLKNQIMPDSVKNNLISINEKYGVKIFLSTNMFEAFKSTDFIDTEFAKWQVASGAKANMPPTIDLLTSKQNYHREGDKSAGFCEAHTSRAISINGNDLSDVEFALRHELMHANDGKLLSNFPDDAGYKDKTKYREEFVKIGIPEGHIDYAYTNPKEFIAVAAEGDLSKCSPEFKKVLMDFGMPKWVFNLDKVDISEAKPTEVLPPAPTFETKVKSFFGIRTKEETIPVDSRVKPNSGVPFKKFYETDIDKTADDIIQHYVKAAPEIRKTLKEFGFEKLGKFSARIKSDYSLRDKIKNFLEEHPSATHKDIWDEVRDCFGFRTVVKSKDYKTHPKVKELIDAGNIKGAMALAAEIQSKPIVEQIKKTILKNAKGDNRIYAARFTNYVSKDGIPYLSEAQLAEIKQFGHDHGIEVDYVKMAAPDDIKAAEMDFDAKPTTRSQPSGYPALQVNFVTKDGDIIEWQFRGEKVNRFAEGEHIPYDLRTGKDITGGNKELEEFYMPFKSILDDMQKIDKPEYPVFKAYNAYLNAHYVHLRKLELGFESAPPKLQDFAPEGYTFDTRLEAENLIKLSDIAHNLKDGKITLEVAQEQYRNI